MPKNFKTVYTRIEEKELERVKRILKYKGMSTYEFLRCCLACADRINFIGHKTMPKQKFKLYTQNIPIKGNWAKMSDAKIITELHKQLKLIEQTDEK